MYIVVAFNAYQETPLSRKLKMRNRKLAEFASVLLVLYYCCTLGAGHTDEDDVHGHKEVDVSECRGDSSTCQVLPEGCTGTADCKAIATWSQEESDHVVIKLWARGSPYYVAMGINPVNSKMYPANVFECIRTSNGTLRVGNSINRITQGNRQNKEYSEGYDSGIHEEHIYYGDGILSCVFDRDVVASQHDNQDFSLDETKKFYILLAVGNLKSDGWEKAQHFEAIASKTMKCLTCGCSAIFQTYTTLFVSVLLAMCIKCNMI